MNFNLITVFQRVIELLAFYLILANIDGKGLKESFIRLFATKQKNLYGNVVVLIAYPFAMAFLIYALPTGAYGYAIDVLLRPFVAYFLLRRTFNFKIALLANILSFVCVLPISIVNLLVSLNLTFIYLVGFVVISVMSYQDYFKGIYVYVVKKRWLFNTIFILSFGLYIIILLGSFSFVLGVSLLSLFLIISVYLHNRNRLKVSKTINLLQSATAENLFQILKELSAEYVESDVINQYTIQDSNINQIAPKLLEILEAQKRQGTIRNYQCVTLSKWQIKVSIIL